MRRRPVGTKLVLAAIASLDELVQAVVQGSKPEAWQALQVQVVPRIEAIARGHDSLRAKGMHASLDEIAEIAEVRTATLERLAHDDFQNLRRYLAQRDAAAAQPSSAFDSWIYGAVDFAVREMIELMKTHRKAGKNIALLYGGEPALRPNIIRAASKMFEATVVYTNGTVGFPDIPVTWMLSLDGTREIHDKIRGKGVFDKVMKNVERDTFREPVVHCTITKQNQHVIEDMVQMVAANERLRGIGFSFDTPELGKHDNGIFIPLEERDVIVDQLVQLSKKYWKTMGFNKGMANQF
ncbi:MAG TPA: hypothetical protein VF331_15630, partial [Polyangiales bacterium]